MKIEVLEHCAKFQVDIFIGFLFMAYICLIYVRTCAKLFKRLSLGLNNIIIYLQLHFFILSVWNVCHIKVKK